MLARLGLVFTTLGCAGGCLPEGEAGVGQALLSLRGLGDLAFTLTPGGDRPGVLYSQRQLALGTPLPSDPTGMVYGNAPEDLFLLEEGAPPQRLLDDYQAPLHWDAAGRLYVQRGFRFEHDPQKSWTGSTFELWRFALGGAPPLSLGRVSRALHASLGTRLVYERPGGEWTLRTLEDRAFPLPPLEEPHFLDEDLYFLQDDALMWLREPDQPPTHILSDVWTYEIVGRANGRTVLRVRSESGPDGVALIPDASPSNADVLTRNALAGPVFSRDGRQLAWIERVANDRGVARLLDLDLLAETHIELPLPPPPPRPARSEPEPPPGVSLPRGPLSGDLEFRPSGDELWCFFEAQVSVIGADGTVRSYPASTRRDHHRYAARFVDPEVFDYDYSDGVPRSGAERRRASRFTADGRFVTVTRGNGETYLADADQPDAETAIRIFGAEDYPRDLLEVAPGRWVAFWSSPSFADRDLYLVDLEKGASRLLVGAAKRVAFGRSRAVVLARVLGSSPGAPGELAVVDLSTGAETRLARNVTGFALAPACAGCDRTDPGAWFAYVVHARVPWKYDGLWSGSLP